MVPTLTTLGRVRECTLLDSKLGAAAVEVTTALCPVARPRIRAGVGVVCVRGSQLGRPTASAPIRFAAMTGAGDRSGDRPRLQQLGRRPGRRSAPPSAAVRRPIRPASTGSSAPPTPRSSPQLDEGGLDLVILDGEAQPTGGAGLARQFKYEIDDCPPVVVLIARKQDGWLASWSLADAVITQPIDPVDAAAVVAEQLRRRLTGIPVVR